MGERFQGFFWKMLDISVPDIRFHDMQLLEGFKIREFEEVVIIVGGSPYIIIPSGEWLLKEGIGFDGEVKKMGLVWVDMRPFETSHRISVSTGGGKLVDIDCGLQFRVTDVIVLVRNLILGYDIMWKDLGQMVYGLLEEVTISEIGKRETLDLTAGTEVLRAALTQQMSYWGMEAVSIRLSESSPDGEEGVPPIQREPAPSANNTRSQLHSPLERVMNNVMKGGQKFPLTIMNWDAASKRWVPQTRKGEVKCDGCGGDCNMYAQCEVVCRASTKCRLCRECYPKRVMCAFLPTRRAFELEDIELQR
jgi:hypothetical protein